MNKSTAKFKLWKIYNSISSTKTFYLLILNTLVKISSIKHHLVIADWNKFAPTNTVNHNQFWLTYIPNNTLIITKIPAIALIWPSHVRHIKRLQFYPLFILAMFSCVRAPWFLIILGLLFFTIRSINYLKYGIIYPSFGVAQDETLADVWCNNRWSWAGRYLRRFIWT